MRSVEKLLDRRGGLMPGLAPLRLAFVLLLVVFQSAEVVGSYAVLSLPGFGMIPAVAIAVLAALAGFSAAANRADTAWQPFVRARLRWTVPIYVLVIVAAVLALGPSVTEFALRDDFTDGDTYAYLLNLLCVPRDQLPGVFEFSDVAGVVNQNVWVAPLYVGGLTVAAATGRHRWTRAVPAIMAAATALGAVLLQALAITPGNTGSFAAVVLRGDGLSALVGGLVGMACFRARRVVPVSGRLAGGCAAILLVLAVVANADLLGTAALRVGVALLAAYLALFLALRVLPLAFAAPRVEPYLLGFFLFSFPLQQTVAAVLPGGGNVGVNLLVASTGSAMLAGVFWRLVGRRLIPAADRAALEATAAGGVSVARSWRSVRDNRGTLVTYLAVGTALVLVVLGMLALVYIALLPGSEGT